MCRRRCLFDCPSDAHYISGLTIRDKAKQKELEDSGKTNKLANLNRDLDKAQEVTKDEVTEFGVYLSDTSINTAMKAVEVVGSSLLTSAVTKTAVTAAIDAGFTAIASRAAVSLINNKGDIGAVLKELSSSANLRAIAASIITAGVSHGLDTTVFQQAGLGSTTNQAITLQQKLIGVQNSLVRSAIKGTINASIRTAIQGGDLGDSIQSAD